MRTLSSIWDLVPQLGIDSWLHVSGMWNLSHWATRKDLKSFFFFFKVYIIVLVLPNIKRIHHRYTCVPHPEPSSLLPPHTIPLGRPSALEPIKVFLIYILFDVTQEL